jgi:hypothetical protein
MRAALALALVLVALPGWPASARAERTADGGTPAGVPACVAVTTSAPYVPYGYNHIVTLANGCKRTADCAVSTDVSPAIQNVTLAPGARAEVLTFMASPSQGFVARVSCQLR